MERKGEEKPAAELGQLVVEHAAELVRLERVQFERVQLELVDVVQLVESELVARTC